MIVEALQIFLKIFSIVDSDKWRTRFEEFLHHDTMPLPSSVLTPKLELKHLPIELKYAFLNQVETFPMVISSQLDQTQEEN